MPDYPDNYPEPLAASYQDTISAGIHRTEMAAGNYKQRRLSFAMQESFLLTFAVPYEIFNEWQNWVNANAYQYFNMPMVSSDSRPDDKCKPRSIRFVGNLSVTSTDGESVYVSVPAEAVGIGTNHFVAGKGWIIAGAPDSPSPEWVIAGSPADPSPEWVEAGTPAAPAVII